MATTKVPSGAKLAQGLVAASQETASPVKTIAKIMGGDCSGRQRGANQSAPFAWQAAEQQADPNTVSDERPGSQWRRDVHQGRGNHVSADLGALVGNRPSVVQEGKTGAVRDGVAKTRGA